jgi:purine nucleoside permease
MPNEGVTAAESMLSENKGYSAYLPSLEAAWVVGSKVVSEIIDNWDEYADALPE